MAFSSSSTKQHPNETVSNNGVCDQYEEKLDKLHWAGGSKIQRQMSDSRLVDDRAQLFKDGFNSYGSVKDDGVEDDSRSSKPNRKDRNLRKKYQRSLSLSDTLYYSSASNSLTSKSWSKEQDRDDVDHESDQESRPFFGNFRSFSRQQKITLAFLALINFGAYLSMSVIAPFFPIEAEERGMPLSTTGYVFSSYALVMFLVSPILGKTITKLGVKFTFISGVFLAAGCNILFGLLDFIDDVTIFTVYCFVLRSIEALGAAAFVTASFTYAAEIFPNNLSAAIGTIETFVGLGMCVGPAVGSALYYLGGYELPFYVLGSFLMSTLPFSIWILPNPQPIPKGSSIPKPGNLLKLALIPKIIIVNLVVMVLCGIWGFLDPTLEPHLREFGVTPATVGFLFLLISGTYSVTCPLVGRFADKWGYENIFMSTGLVFTALCLVLMGPDVLLPFLPRTLWLNIIGLTLMGITIGVGLIPTFQSMLQTAYDHGYEDNTVTYGLISSLFSASSSLGEFVGPALGSFLYEKYNYDFASTSIGLFTIGVAILLIVYEVSKLSMCRKKRVPSSRKESKSSPQMSDSGIYESIITDEDDDDETSALLSRQHSVP